MSYHIIRSELSANAAGGWSFLKALISVMSALHNWIIDAERYKILLSLHLSPSHFDLLHPHSLWLILAFKLKWCKWLYFSSFCFFLWYECILVIVFFLKFYIKCQTTYILTYINLTLNLIWVWSGIALSYLRRKTAHTAGMANSGRYSIIVFWKGNLRESFL